MHSMEFYRISYRKKKIKSNKATTTIVFFLKEYPAARVRLEAIAVKRLEKYKKAPLEKGLLFALLTLCLLLLCSLSTIYYY